jgi:hypothetical protein
MPSLEPVLRVYRDLYPDQKLWSKPFLRLAAIAETRRGSPLKDAAKSVGATTKGLQRFLNGDPILEMFGATFAEVHLHNDGRSWKLAKRGIGQILLGQVAEKAFERLYKRELGTDDLQLEDSRDQRTDTDYRVLNGGGKAVFRINIKMHGTPFRRSEELVGLRSDDCFALGTYVQNPSGFA